MSVVAERGHAGILSDTLLAPDRVSVTMPLVDRLCAPHTVKRRLGLDEASSWLS
jgi:hypothetical protein